MRIPPWTICVCMMFVSFHATTWAIGVAPIVGADVAFATYEAEDAATSAGAAVVRMRGFPSDTQSSPEVEASGRAFVQLAATGDSVEFGDVTACNTIVVRHCIPDAPGGGGDTRTLSLYVNGSKRQTLTLSSRHNWLYGDAGHSQNGQENDPAAGVPHVFWEEQRFWIDGDAVAAGSTIRLRKDAGDDAAYYRIDLIDLEMASPPKAPPAEKTYLSVTAFGADGGDDKDDTAAIQACIDAAGQQGKIVWIPAGTFYQSRKFTKLANITVQGAGMWHTQIIGTTTGGGWIGTVGFHLDHGSHVRDLFIEGAAQTSRPPSGSRAITGGGVGWSVENLWITHTRVGIWVGGHDAVIRGCRVRFTYSDAIHITSGETDSYDILVEHNHVRGVGDDGIAILSEIYPRTPTTRTHDCTIRHNTVTAGWWAACIDLAGGSGHVFEYNLLADPAWTGGFIINHPASYPMHPLTGGVFRYNRIVRGGGNLAAQNRGAIWIWPGDASIDGMSIHDNTIVDPVFHGIHLTGSKSQRIAFERNVIERPGKDGIHIDGEANGSGTFTGNVITNMKPGFRPFNNTSKTYQANGEGNSWPW